MRQGAIFDMDGLMFDTERLYQLCWNETALAFGQPPAVGFDRAIGGTSGAKMRQVIRDFYPTFDPEAYISAALARLREIEAVSLPEKPGLRTILDGLKSSGCKLAVASASPEDLIHNNLKKSGLEDFFDAVLSAEHLLHGKPAPDVFLLAADALHLPPQDCYVFEDSFNGVRAAAAAGCVPIMVPDLIAPTEEIRHLAAGVFPDLNAAWLALRAEQI